MVIVQMVITTLGTCTITLITAVIGQVNKNATNSQYLKTDITAYIL